jgi:hypothetical protein
VGHPPRRGLGRDARLPAGALGPGAWAGRGHGYRAAGMGVDWATALELIQRTMRGARPIRLKTARRLRRGDRPQGAGRSDGRRRDHRRLCRADGSDRGRGRADHPDGHAAPCPPSVRMPTTYATVYDTLLSQAAEPVILHWLGDMFDPALAGYWGTRDVAVASDIVLGSDRAQRGQRSTGSRSRCSTRNMSRRSAPGCRRGCGSIQGTISTMRR